MTIRSNFYVTSLGVMAISFAGQTHVLAQSPTANWSGPYVGAFGGYGTGSSAQHDNGFVYSPPNNGENGCPADGHYGVRGAVGGVLAGYNYQYNMFVLGLEGDIAGTSIKGHSNFCGSPAHDCGTSVDLTSDLRGRIGIPFGLFMPFVAGGLAVDRISAYDSLFGAAGAKTVAGWTVGAGIEYKVTPNLGVRLEYLHSQFDPSTVFDIVPGVPERISLKTDIVRAGITFSFNPPPPLAPVIAKY
jgi:outer membrane immunogenic protein